MLYWQLFCSFFTVGVFCVGGGYASVPLIQAQVIDLHHWLTMPEFMDIFAISQMTPGPIGINAATFVGSRIAGVGGSLAATLGFVTPSLLIMLALAWILQKYGSLGAVRGVLNGLRSAVVALVASAGCMFLCLAVWNVAKPASMQQLATADWGALGLIIWACFVSYKKIFGPIQTIIAGGVLNLLLYVALR